MSDQNVSADHRVLVIGGGLAGAKTVEALREQGFSGPVTLVAGEDLPPYERPPLSKGYLQGEQAFDEAVVHPAEWYAEQKIDLRRGVRAVSVDAAARTVALEDGSELGYDSLVLATGSTPVRPALPGADAEGVLTLRTRADADALRSRFGASRHLVVVGGGWIGLEAAASARAAGTEVTVLVRGEQPLLKAVGPEVAPVFTALHREHGVDLRTGVTVREILSEGGLVTGVVLEDGTVLPADTVLLGTGASPNLELARSAGLELEDGVVVDAALRSSDVRVFAVGDIASAQYPLLRRRLRVEHWATALNQPAVVARAIRGEDAEYEELPYFFSDQFDLGMEYLGAVAPGEKTSLVVRGDLDKREFVAFWLGEDRAIRAVMNVNVWDVPDAVKPLILARKPVDPARLADPSVPFTEL